MQQLILNSNLYQDIDTLATLVKTMEYDSALYGKEIKNFSYVPAGLSDFFSEILRTPIEIQPDTGIFRKPTETIHFENFYQHSLWLGIAALENTKLKLYKHKETGSRSFFDVKDDIQKFVEDNVIFTGKWDVASEINIEKNDFVFIRPWLWHSLESEKIVQVFMLNQRLEIKKED